MLKVCVYLNYKVYLNETSLSHHAITVVSPTIELRCPAIGGSHSFVCWMHRNNTQFILFDTQFMYQFQELNVPNLCKGDYVNRGSTLLRFVYT